MQPNTSPPDLSLVDVQLAFAHWRKTRSGREATPHRLKQMAVRLLATESRASVCKALAINTSTFKQWTGADSAGRAATPAAQFVELDSLPEPTVSSELGVASSAIATITLPNGVEVKTTGTWSLPELLNAANQVRTTL